MTALCCTFKLSRVGPGVMLPVNRKPNSFQKLLGKLFCLGSWNFLESHLFERRWVNFFLIYIFFSNSLFVELTLTVYFLFLPKLTWIALKVIQTLFWEPFPLGEKLSHSV